jgi:hypothetical protein
LDVFGIATVAFVAMLDQYRTNLCFEEFDFGCQLLIGYFLLSPTNRSPASWQHDTDRKSKAR